MDDSGSSNRQYQGFYIPPTGTGSHAAPAAPGGMPYFSTAGAAGMVRRGYAAGAAQPPPPPGGGSVGYGYFHRPTSSAGGHSGFAALSDTGSSHSNPLHLHTRVSTSAGSGSGARPQAVQVRIDTETPPSVADGAGAAAAATAGAGGGAAGGGDRESSIAEYPATPTTTTTAVLVETRHGHPHAGLPRPSPWAAGATPPRSTFGTRPPTYHNSSTSIAFLPSTTAAMEGGGEAGLARDPLSRSPREGARGGGAGGGPFVPRPSGPFSPSPPLLAPVGGGRSGGPGLTPGAAGHGGFLKDIMNRLLSDLDEGDGGMGGAGGRASAAPRPLHQTRFGCPEDDLPLWEELGIFPSHMWCKARAVLNPFRPMPMDSVEDTDLAGPICFALALAFLLSLQGKIQFSAIYGLCVLGILFFKVLLTLMRADGGGSGSKGAPLQLIISSLGYSLLPSLVLAVLRALQYWLAGSHSRVLLPLAFVVIGWSSWCATSLLARGLSMEPQRFLILYPMVLFYALFAALTIF